MQRVHHPGDRSRPGGRRQGLGEHLAAEHPLQRAVRLAGAEQVALDLLQVEEVDQLVDGRHHGPEPSGDPLR